MKNDYDVIVVGARCAGAPTAMLLARKGYRVLVVDRGSFPSDTVSTHMIHAPGVDALRRWGLLDDVVASGCPPITTYRFDFGPFTIGGTPRAVGDGERVGYAPRRTVLDTILVDAAAHAGADVRERFTFDDVVVEDGTVVGIHGHSEGGHPIVERAKVVIGADGVSSRVARAVSAPAYNEKPVLQGGAYTYWSGLDVDGFETVIRPHRGFATIPTNDGLTLVVVGLPAAELPAFKADIEANYLATLELAPRMHERIAGARREDRFHFGTVPNFFRRPFGPGWLLVGDAGYAKDPVTAQGITDAFHDAERCANALDRVFSNGEPYENAMADCQRERDERAVPVYEFTTQLATLEPPPEEVQRMLAGAIGNQHVIDTFVSVVAGTASPAELFAPAVQPGP